MTLEESTSYYRSHLTDSSKSVYDRLYREMEKDMTALSYNFIVPEKCSTDDCSVAYHALVMDHPELYQLQYGISIKVLDDMVEIKMARNFSKNIVDLIEKKLHDFIAKITRGVDDRSSFEKEFIVYSRLSKMLDYSSKEVISHSILGPILTNKGSCDGRSKLLALCLRAVHVPCILVKDDTHMWNMASINGHNVWLDCTYEVVHNDRVAYFYFNLNDSQIAIDHVIDENLPKCNEDYGFFKTFALEFTTRQEVKNYIQTEHRKGSDTISFKLKNADKETLVAAMLDGLPKSSGNCNYMVNQSNDAVIMTFGKCKKNSPIFRNLRQQIFKILVRGQ